MNYKNLAKILGKIMILEGGLMLLPLAVGLFYREDALHILAFAAPTLLLVAIGALLQLLKPVRSALYQKEGFALTAAVWFVLPLFGALPLVISGDIPNYIDAFFEISSGFTTTGASIIEDITAISRSVLFWRSLSHWIGGMGVLVFVLSFIPESEDGSAMHLLRAESPGPKVGKLVSKMKVTTRILYLIYFGLTVLEVAILMLDKPIPGYENDKFFFSLLATFGCAGTGGFGFLPESMAYFSPFSQYVMAIFLLLFGCNFGLYYLLLLGKAREMFRSEEFRAYVLLVCASVGFIFVSLVGRFESLPQVYSNEEAFRHALFQVASLITTAGYTTTDYNVWPTAATMVLLVVSFTGGMAGSTAGGLKLSRIVLAVKGTGANIRKLIAPRYVARPKFEGKPIEQKTLGDVFSYITLYFFLLILTVFLLCFDPINGTFVTIVSDAGVYTVEHGFFSNFSAAVACLSNVGPAFEAVGPYASYAGYSMFSKSVLTLAMIVGRLEILPVLILFHPRTWKKT